MIVPGSYSHKLMFPNVTLLTDFGTADGYVAAVKGVLASRVPGVCIHDATHGITPGDIFAGSHALRRYWNRFPAGTVHVAVVDPGVGSPRRAIAARADGYGFIAPDNGILSLVLEDAHEKTVVAIENQQLIPAPESNTFHARDVFAPAAAHLLSGTDLRYFGPLITDWVSLEVPAPVIRDNSIAGIVVSTDRFGNLITNIPNRLVRQGALVLLADREIGVVSRTYADVVSGCPVALINSDGVLEVALRDGSAAQRLRAGNGTPVTLLA